METETPTPSSTNASCANYNMGTPVCRFLYIGVPLISLTFFIIVFACILWGVRNRRKTILKRNKGMGVGFRETYIISDGACEASEADLEKKRAWERWWAGKAMSPIRTFNKNASFVRLSYDSYASMTLQSCDSSLRCPSPGYAESTLTANSVRTSFEDVDIEGVERSTTPLPPSRLCTEIYSATEKRESMGSEPDSVKLAVKPYLRIQSWPPGRDIPEIRLEAVLEEEGGNE
ncbi:hypothetical protein ABW19_dt0200787 [Dactylella cylindrospora]|nr:hypothetical protein ABW19_dt0200787 [Dactylella cylindrospora]